MTYHGSYGILLALHLLTVAFIVGPLAVATSLSGRYAREGNEGALKAAARTTTGYGYASLLTVVLGSAMLGRTAPHWSASQAWVGASYALWLVAVGLSLLVVAPAQRAALIALADGAPADGFAKRIAPAAGVAALAWTAIIVLMVFKPGA